MRGYRIECPRAATNDRGRALRSRDRIDGPLDIRSNVLLNVVVRRMGPEQDNAPRGEDSTAECQVFSFDADRVRRVQRSLLGDEVALAAADLFKAVANPTRAKILLALSCEELCVCDLAQVLEMSVSAVSHHLQHMRRAGVLRFRAEGKLVYYAAVDGCVLQMLHEALAHLGHRRRRR